MEAKRTLEQLRQIDALIAEKVMGWANVQNGCFTPAGQEWCGDDPSGKGGFHDTGRKIIPRYSIDVKAALTIVDKIRDQQFDVFMNNTSEQIDRRWYVHITKLHGSKDRQGVGLNVSLEEAICEAALSLHGIQK